MKGYYDYLSLKEKGLVREEDSSEAEFFYTAKDFFDPAELKEVMAWNNDSLEEIGELVRSTDAVFPLTVQ